MKKSITFNVTQDSMSSFTVEYSAKVTAETEEEALQVVYDNLYTLGNFQEDEEAEDVGEEAEEESESDDEPKGELIEKMQEGYVTIDQVAELMDITSTNIQNKVNTGKFPRAKEKWGRKNIWKLTDIESYLPTYTATDAAEEILEKRETMVIERVSTITGFDEETIDMLVENEKFPSPNEDGDWYKDDIDAYMKKRGR